MILKYCLVGLAVLALIKADSARHWVEPHAWGRNEQEQDNLGGTGSCPSCSCNDLATVKPLSDDGSMQEKISFIYYKKLVAFLFDRKNYQYDEESRLFNRALVFSATEQQLKLFESSTDPRDWDAVLTELIQNVKKPPTCEQGFTTFGPLSMLKLFITGFFSQFSLSSEIQFILLAMAAVLAIIFLHRRYRYGLIMTALLGFFIFGFLITYLDCNRKLQIEEMVEFMDGGDDPCAEKKSSGFWGFFNFFRGGYSKSQCIEHLKKKHRVRLAYCRPDEVFLTYINEVILNQFRLIIEKCTEIIKGSSEKMPFPYNIVAMLIFGFTLTTFLKLTFKHVISPKVWFSHSSGQTSKTTTQHSSEESSRDNISGENLRLLLESFKHSVSRNEKPNSSEEPIASGVEVLESLAYKREKAPAVESDTLADNVGSCSKCGSDESSSKASALCSIEDKQK